MIMDIAFGLIDTLAGILLYINLSHFSIPAILSWFLLLFLVVKGLSTIFHVPIWVGPVFFIAGIVDAVAGFFLYMQSPELHVFATVLGVILILKGLWTVLAPLSS